MPLPFSLDRRTGTALRVAWTLAGAMLYATSMASATVIQTVQVEYDPEPDRSGTAIVDRDEISVPISTDIDRDLLASIADPGGLWSASGSVGRFGNFGVQGSIVQRGNLLVDVEIESTEFINLTSVPQRLQARFIVDGGELVMAFAPSASLSLNLRLSAYAQSSLSNFASTITLSDSAAGGSLDLSTAGRDLGAVFNGPNRVEIPFSFQTAELGVLQPGERLRLVYQLQIIASVPNFAEILRFEFSDPLNVDGTGMFPGSMDITMTPVPEPGTAALLGLGLALLARRLPRGDDPARRPSAQWDR